MKVVYSFFVFLLFITSSFSQLKRTKATIVNAYPTVNEILKELNGQGVTLTNPKLEAGVINGTYGRIRWLSEYEGDSRYVEDVLGDDGSQIVIFKDGYRAGFGMNEGVLFSTGNALLDLDARNNQFAIRGQAQKLGRKL